MRDFLKGFQLKMLILSSNQANKGIVNQFICQKSVVFKQLYTGLFNLRFNLIVHAKKIDENIKLIDKFLQKYLPVIEKCMEVSEEDSETVKREANDLLYTFELFLMILFLEKTIEFELVANNFKIEKIAKYSNSSPDDQIHQDAYKKYIVRRTRYFKLSSFPSKISFLQFYYLYISCPKQSSGESVWDFNVLANKEDKQRAFMKEFTDNFDLFEYLRYNGHTLQFFLEQFLVDPMSNKKLSNMGSRILDRQKENLICFMREKCLYYVLTFHDDETRMEQNEFSEYTFEYEKLHNFINTADKLRSCKLMKIMMQDNTKSANSIIKVVNLNIVVDVDEAMFKESSTQVKPVKVTGFQHISKVESELVKINHELSSQNKEKNKQSRIVARSSGGLADLKYSSTNENDRVQKRIQQMEMLFKPTYDQIIQKEMTHAGSKDIIQNIGDKLELFDHNSQLIAKGTLIYSNFSQPIVKLLKKYQLSRMKYSEANCKVVDADMNLFYRKMKRLGYKACSEWGADFNISRQGLIDSLKSSSTKSLTHQKRLYFQSNFSKTSGMELSKPFKLAIDIRFKALNHSVILVEKMQLNFYYPMLSTVKKLKVMAAEVAILILRITQLRSARHREIILSQLFKNVDETAFYFSLKVKKNNQFYTDSEDKDSRSVMVPSSKVVNIYLENCKSLTSMQDYFDRSLGTRSPFQIGEELRIVDEKNDGKDYLKKPYKLGFTNPFMKMLLQPDWKKKEGGYHTADGIKNILSKNNHLTGKPEMPVHPHFQQEFYFKDHIQNFGEVYISSHIYLILQRITNVEEQCIFEDCQYTASNYFDVLANRLWHISKLYFKNSKVSKDDLPYIRAQFVRTKARRALGFHDDTNTLALNMWHDTLTRLDDARKNYGSSVYKIQNIKSSIDNIDNLMMDLKQKKQQDDRLVLEGENLFICLDISPRYSRTQLYRVVLTWTDIKQFLYNEGFIKYMFPGVTSYDQVEKFFSKACARQIFNMLLRHIMSHCRMIKQRVYSSPVFLQDINTKKPEYLKNIYMPFSNKKGAAHQKSFQSFSKNSQIVYHGIRRVEKSYLVITVTKNIQLKVFEIIIYNPKYCREYSMSMKTSAVQSSQVAFLAALCRFVHTLSPYGKIKSYEAFDILWSAVNNKVQNSSLKVFSDNSLSPSFINSINETVIEAEGSIMDTSILPVRNNSLPRSKQNYINLQANQLFTSKKRSSFIDMPKTASGSPLSRISKLSELFDLSNKIDTLEDLKWYLTSTYRSLKSTAFLTIFKDVEKSIFCHELLKNTSVVDGNLFNEITDISPSVLRFVSNMHSLISSVSVYLETIFWEGLCRMIQIRYIKDDNQTRMLLTVEGETYYLRDVYCMKEFLNPKKEDVACRVFVNLDKIKKNNKGGKHTSVLQMFNRINEPFPKLNMNLLSYMRFEFHMYTVIKYGDGSSKIEKLKKFKTLKELLNLLMAENIQNSELFIGKLINLGDVRMLAQFLVYKLKQVDNFSLLVDKKDSDDEESEFKLRSNQSQNKGDTATQKVL